MSPQQSSYVNTLGYEANGGDCVISGGNYQTSSLAPYISHMASMEADGVSKAQLFGLAWGDSCGAEEGKNDIPGACGIVWRAELDNKKEIAEYKSKKIWSAME